MRFSRDNLHPYQDRAVRFIKERNSCALWVDMGLGKTVSTLTAVAEMMADMDAWRVLVIAPLRVATTTWPDEVRRWEHTRHLGMRVLNGSPEQRRRIVEHDRSDIHVIGRDLVTWLANTYSRLPYDTIVIDEASSFKDPSTKRFKALRRSILPGTRIIELTGTPAPNGLLGLWPQMFLLDRGDRLGKTYTGYRERYFQCDYSGYAWTPREDAEEKIYSKLQDICLTLSAADYLRMPDRIDNTVPVVLPDRARAQYIELERDFLLKLEDAYVSAQNAAVLTNKLVQLANGAAYIDDAGTWAEVHTGKLDALEEIVAGAIGPVLVAYNFRSDLARITDRFPQAVAIGKDPATIARWNRGEIPLLLAHPASAGHGLNLQTGGATIVWFGLNWSLELYQQFNARLHRQGQTRPVIVHHLIAQATVDETIMAALGNKHQTQQALLDALRADVQERLLR